MCKITIMDGITADAHVDADVQLYANAYTFCSKGNTSHIERKVRDLFAGIEANKNFTLHIDQPLTFNRVTYEAARINVTPKAVGIYPDGHAWMAAEGLTESARRKAEPIVAAALVAVQKNERRIIEAAKQQAAEMINRYADDLIATAQAAKDQARAAQ